MGSACEGGACGCRTSTGGLACVIKRSAAIVALSLAVALVHREMSPAISLEFKQGSGIKLPVTSTDQAGKAVDTPKSSQTSGVQTTPNNPSTSSNTSTPSTPVQTSSQSSTSSTPPMDSDGAKMLTTEQTKALYDQGLTQFVDARALTEFEKGHIPGSISLPAGDFTGDKIIATDGKVNMRLNRSMNVVVYCGGGDCSDSKLVAKELVARGFSMTAVYHDGWNGWSAAGHPKSSGAELPPGVPPMIDPPASAGGSQ
ncbi:MAG: rhodanese-like domain-containing protein [Phycisphaerales bacterium]|nr:rhodanese-like domain-containing protein [Phycisphaerales bacterium]